MSAGDVHGTSIEMHNGVVVTSAQQYDVDDALDSIGFGNFQRNLVLLCG
jgi:hypothetical protein